MKGIFQKQPIMRRVVFALLPIYLFSVYLYGWRVLSLSVAVFAFGILTEYLVERTRKKKVSEAVLVTCMLYTLSLPPAAPHWIAIVGIVFGVFFGKEIFGGFGRNVFNPTIVGRLFIYITFPTVLATAWMIPGNFGTLGMPGVDALTAATPLAVWNSPGGELPNLMGRLFGIEAGGWLNMLLGFRAGSIGESSIVLILLGAFYLLRTKTAQWRLIVSTLLTEAILISIFYLSGLATQFVPHLALMSGSLFYVSVFMCTDPVSAPNKPLAQWLYGFIIGSTAVVIRTFSGFPEGTSFAVLIGNIFASLLDELVPKPKKKRAKAPAAVAAKAGEGAPKPIGDTP